MLPRLSSLARQRTVSSSSRPTVCLRNRSIGLRSRTFATTALPLSPLKLFASQHSLDLRTNPILTKHFCQATEDIVQPELDFDKYNVPVELKGKGVESFKPVENFRDMNLGSTVLTQLERARWGSPTPVQKYGIPLTFLGRDLMSCAQTGSGKTAAFLFPMITRIAEQKTSSRPQLRSTFYPKGLVLEPTRELAQQVEQQASQFGAGSPRVTAAAAYGGASSFAQIKKMERGCDIIVATPGRLQDYIQRNIVSLEQVQWLVLDEADRMLDMGFEPQIRDIVERSDLPPKTQRQTTMFSATFPREIQQLAASFLKDDYLFLTIGRVGAAAELVTQRFNLLESTRHKQAELLEQLKAIPGRTLVFVETKLEADRVQLFLKEHGWAATSIHGDRGQSQRDAALSAFATGRIQILVATDVAARGLDVKNIVHVINYDVPRDIDSYVHRIGRTGRAGVRGTATAFFLEENFGIARDLVNMLIDANHEIPKWLEEASTRPRRNMNSPRSRQPSRIGRDQFGAPQPKTYGSSRFDSGRSSSRFDADSSFSGGFGSNRSSSRNEPTRTSRFDANSSRNKPKSEDDIDFSFLWEK